MSAQTDPAATLRAAAAKLRETAGAAAEDAKPGAAWHVDYCDEEGCACMVTEGRAPYAVNRYIADAETPELAAWIALMGLPVGLALADWLEATAEEAERHAAQHFSNYEEEIADGHPMAVARAVLGVAR